VALISFKRVLAELPRGVPLRTADPQDNGLSAFPNGHPKVLFSLPERALLEMLSDVGKNQSLEEARQLVETLRSLRVKTLDEWI
jgi:hypothetical protein